MHAEELSIDARLAARLIAEQFPQWRGERVRAVSSTATAHAIFRVGDGLAARFRLLGGEPEAVEGQLRAEASALAELRGCSPFDSPEPVGLGRPAPGYPLPWSVQTWLEGEVATPGGLARSSVFTEDLIALITALRGADTHGRTFAGGGRGGDLWDHDEWVETCLLESKALLEVARLGQLWQRLRIATPVGPDVMCHGDLIPANLLVRAGRLVGVLDGGGFGPADRALDLVSAWHLLEHPQREKLRSALGCSAGEWLRGAAWAFEQAIGLVWYYRVSNPGMSALGRSTLARLLDDPGLAAGVG